MNEEGASRDRIVIVQNWFYGDAGARSSSRPGRSVWSGIPRGKRPPARYGPNRPTSSRSSCNNTDSDASWTDRHGPVEEAEPAPAAKRSGNRFPPPPLFLHDPGRLQGTQGDSSRLGGCRQTLDVERVRPQTTRRQSVTETRTHGFDSLRLHHCHCMRSVSGVPASSKVACGSVPAAEQARTSEDVQERPARRFGSLVPVSARHAYASLADARSSFGDNGSRDDGAPQR